MLELLADQVHCTWIPSQVILFKYCSTRQEDFFYQYKGKNFRWSYERDIDRHSAPSRSTWSKPRADSTSLLAYECNPSLSIGLNKAICISVGRIHVTRPVTFSCICDDRCLFTFSDEMPSAVRAIIRVKTIPFMRVGYWRFIDDESVLTIICVTESMMMNCAHDSRR